MLKLQSFWPCVRTHSNWNCTFYFENNLNTSSRMHRTDFSPKQKINWKFSAIKFLVMVLSLKKFTLRWKRLVIIYQSFKVQISPQKQAVKIVFNSTLKYYLYAAIISSYFNYFPNSLCDCLFYWHTIVYLKLCSHMKQ